MKITPEFLATFDWSKTAVGSMDTWPVSLKAMVSMILALPTPAIIFWGPSHAQIYNDGYAVIMGPRHPKYFGSTFEECWPETYPLFAHSMRKILDEGIVVVIDRTQITLTRHGFNEEAHFTFTFSAIRDDEGKIAGVYQPVVEVTDAVLRERRQETLRTLASRDDVLRDTTISFEQNPHDLPFAGIFLWNEMQLELQLLASAGAPLQSVRTWLEPSAAALRKSFTSNEATTLDVDLPPSGPWPEEIRRLLLVPIRRTSSDEPAGVIAFGLSPRLSFDDRYRQFLEAAAREVGSNLAAQRAQEAENEWRERELATRHEAEAAKEEYTRRMTAVFENAPVGIAVLRGPNHVFEVANPDYAKLVGNRPLLGRPLREAFSELAGQGILELVAGVYETGVPFLGRSVPIALAREDGVLEPRFFDFAYRPIPKTDGTTDSIIVVVFETTELSTARRDAEAASRAKDSFFAILGHELRNPLAPITTALQLMRLRGDTTLIEERSIIERQVAQITRLVDDLLDVSRITGGKVALKVAPIEISEVVAAAIETASPLLDQRHHHLEVDVPARGLVVVGDPIRLAQVIGNLLNNAAKYTEPGGTVRITAEKKGDRALLYVSDTGIGIGPEMISQVFEPFTQDHQALDRAQGGLGLGLAIAANLVKLHGGEISASSAGRGHGSTFTIDLPLSTGPAVETAPSRIVPTGRASTEILRVLIVDDNEDAADMLGAALATMGCDIRIANDATHALRLAAESKPQVALLDIGLPVMDGYELARRLRSTFGKSMRLVAVTGYGQASDLKLTAEAGFDAHLVKPVQLDAVIDLMNRYRTEGPRQFD